MKTEKQKNKPTAPVIVARLSDSFGGGIALLFKVDKPYPHYAEDGEEVPDDAIESWQEVNLPAAESEDERTRKEIIEFIEWADARGSVRNDWHQAKRPSEWITYLEKQKEPTDKGEVSDGYHTFNELYYYRLLYNAAFFNLLPKEWVHKSKKHHDGEECFGGGWFIVMANLPTGQISNHYELKDWELFQIPEKEVADEWDGHSPQEAADRLHKYLLEKQKEQTEVDLDEEVHRFFEECIEVHEVPLYGKVKERVIPVDCYEITARHFAKWGEKQKEQKPAECISDSVQFDEGFKTGREVGFREGVESVKQPTEDWREKRKKECPFRRKLDNNLYGCERYADVFCECNGNCSWVVDYPKLKEIQDRKEQKPSEEQMEALESAVKLLNKINSL